MNEAGTTIVFFDGKQPLPKTLFGRPLLDTRIKGENLGLAIVGLISDLEPQYRIRASTIRTPPPSRRRFPVPR